MADAVVSAILITLHTTNSYQNCALWYVVSIIYISLIIVSHDMIYLGLKRIMVFGIQLFFSENYRIFEYSLVCTKCCQVAVMLIMCFIINTTKHDLITGIK